MTSEQQVAIAEVRATYPHHQVDVEEASEGSVWLILRGADIGNGWNQPVIDLAVKLLVTFPSTPPYPFYGPAGLARRDGASFSPLQSNVAIDNSARAQISLTKAFDPRTETLGSRFVAVLNWLRNPR